MTLLLPLTLTALLRQLIFFGKPRLSPFPQGCRVTPDLGSSFPPILTTNRGFSHALCPTFFFMGYLLSALFAEILFCFLLTLSPPTYMSSLSPNPPSNKGTHPQISFFVLRLGVVYPSFAWFCRCFFLLLVLFFFSPQGFNRSRTYLPLPRSIGDFLFFPPPLSIPFFLFFPVVDGAFFHSSFCLSPLLLRKHPIKQPTRSVKRSPPRPSPL